MDKQNMCWLFNHFAILTQFQMIVSKGGLLTIIIIIIIMVINLNREIESLIIAALNNAIRTNYIKAKIDSIQENN